jgi:hypothetical protein
LAHIGTERLQALAPGAWFRRSAGGKGGDSG